MLPGRVIVVGDVHGCVDELKALMRKVDYVQGNDTLILAGDLVDKGPDSIGVSPLLPSCMLFNIHWQQHIHVLSCSTQSMLAVLAHAACSA